MNYRHAFHAGNFADVLKHVLLRELIRAMQRKPKPFLFLDTHAGRGRYDLAQAETGARAPEWPEGIGRLWNAADLLPPIADYVAAIRDYNRACGAGGETLRFYPGSPLQALALLRPDDRCALCELQPEEADALERECAGRRKVRVHRSDGFGAPRAMLPPLEKRALVLIDPPFEAADEMARVARAVEEGLRRSPAAVFAIWYPITKRAATAPLFLKLRERRLAPTLAAELRVQSEEAEIGLSGCGLAILNPPWQFDAAMRPALAQLTRLLALDGEAGFRMDWLVPEST
ncbi:MAG TPA: 23S rRNA (adenine(2030)-N(6))-methyltransferase RlmJ [Opitutaceae bacterium]|nr:23S rRNA (adenine(2030)-N(6))-methyltransferase RlmJ [Opitutaceae bacterium]